MCALQSSALEQRTQQAEAAAREAQAIARAAEVRSHAFQSIRFEVMLSLCEVLYTAVVCTPQSVLVMMLCNSCHRN